VRIEIDKERRRKINQSGCVATTGDPLRLDYFTAPPAGKCERWTVHIGYEFSHLQLSDTLARHTEGQHNVAFNAGWTRRKVGIAQLY